MDIKHNLKIKASAETIYRAMSTNEGMKGRWCKDSVVGESVGETSILKFDKEGTIVPMDFKTEELVKNSKVVWRCTSNPNPMWVETRLVTEIKKVLK